MEQFKENLSNIQPQLVSIILVTLILIIFAVVVYKKVQKIKPHEAPTGFLLLTEQYVSGVENLFQSVSNGKINPVGPYIFTLLSFLIIGNLFGLVGFEPPTTSYSVPMTLGLVSWTGIYVVGIIYEKHRFFKKFIYNPTELLSQFSPFISISFRLFGNMISGSTILFLITHFLGFVWGKIPVVGDFNLLGVMITPPLHIYFDLFDGVIQGFVFTLLTMIYWSLEAPQETDVEQVVDLKKEVIFYEDTDAEKALNKNQVQSTI